MESFSSLLGVVIVVGEEQKKKTFNRIEQSRLDSSWPFAKLTMLEAGFLWTPF